MKVLGYQFPNPDERWLIMNFKVKMPGRSWEFTDPCLEDFDLTRLASCLLSWADTPTSEDTLEFTEIVITFRKLASAGPAIVLEVGLDGEGHPERRDWADDPFWVKFELTRDLLCACAAELSSEFAKIAR